MNGYIYIRIHESYKFNDYICCKLGKTFNFLDRDSTYATAEIIRGTYKIIYEVQRDKMDIIEKLLHRIFKEYNVRHNAGEEFYEIKVIDLIESVFLKVDVILNIKSRRLTDDEIKSTLRVSKEKKKVIKDEDQDNEEDKLYKLYKSFVVPREDQNEIIEKALDYYKNPLNTKGILVIPCGVGKTLISLWIALRFDFKNIKNIIIGVPNLLLINQWERSIKLIDPYLECFKVNGEATEDDIKNFVDKNINKKYVIITTYSSSFKFSSVKDFIFDVKILDEVHHLTSTNINIKNEEERKSFVKILNIKCVKQISLTATLKILDLEKLELGSNSISNNNVEYFGEIIEKKSLLWAINKNIVCDYVIQTIVTNHDKFVETFEYLSIDEDCDKRLFISAFIALKSIKEGCSHHLLIYNNNKYNSTKVISYLNIVKELLNMDDDLYYSSYNSDMKQDEQKEILKNFEKSKYGIISCVYCLGEGWDFPILDGVVFAENMSSNIRIVQSALRASRKNILEPKKITKIILPVLSNDNFLEDENNEDLKKVKEVIYQMSLEDETITEKIKVFLNKKEEKISEEDEKKEEYKKHEFGEYDEIMTKSLRLKSTRRMQLGITYQKAKKIVKHYNLKTKEDYYEVCKKDLRLTEDPEEAFGKTFLGWIDYLGIDIHKNNKKYYTIEECHKKVEEWQKNNRNITQISDIIEELCKIDDCFPPKGLWTEYYRVNKITDIVKVYVTKRVKG